MSLAELSRVREGLAPSNEANMFARKAILWHRVGLTDSASGSPGTLSFFNAGRSKGITNMPRASSLPGGWFFALDKIGIVIERGFDIAGNSEAEHPGMFGTDTKAATSAEVLRRLYEHGIVKCEVGNRIVADDIYGVHNFPWGAQAVVPGVSHFTSTCTENITTGTGSSQDGFWQEPSIPILPDKEIKFTIDWSNLTYDTLGDLVVKVGLFGTLLTATGI